MMNPDIFQAVEVIFILFFAVVIHECAHGWVALKLGDPTAKLAGRLTLNPLKHIDPVGTIIVPFLTHIFGGFLVGWAKPVPVNFMNLNHPKRDMIWVALAGPAINVAIAVLASLARKLNPSFFDTVIIINLMLAVFNLTPIPPLDGSRIVTGLLPNDLARSYVRLEPFGFIIIIILLQAGLFGFVGEIVVTLAKMLGVAG